MIDISQLDKAAVLAALYNAARPLGMGYLHYDPKPMTRDEAAEILGLTTDDIGLPKKSAYFDYLKGRVMKVNLSGDTFNEALFDRDNGDGAAARALKPLRST